MKHNLKGIFRLTEARTFWVRAVRAWRNLLPDWTPSLDELRALEDKPHEHRAAVQIVSHGWDNNDPRWDVLMALLEWERREAFSNMSKVKQAFDDFRERSEADFATSLKQFRQGEKVSLDEEHERLREDSETTVETPFLRACHWCDEVDDGERCVIHDEVEDKRPQLVLVPKIPPKVFTVRTLASIRAEQQGEES